MNVLDWIGPWEDLGRGISSSRNARRAEHFKVPVNEFLPRMGVTAISVDRLSVGSLQEATAIADARDGARVPQRRFYGWAVVIAENAARNGRQVAATPTEGNPRHADIILPASAANDRVEQKRHALELRDSSTWRPRAD